MKNIQPIGNDIIDWQTAKTQHQKLRIRCLKKLFSTQEIDYIFSFDHALMAFWHLWSVKESAYKSWHRTNNTNPIFNPLSIRCKDFQSNSVSVEIDRFNYTVKTIYTDNYIYSQCQSKNNNHIILNSKVNFIEYKAQLAEKGWKIVKTKNNIPNLIHRKNGVCKPVSITHDRDFIALSW